MHTLLLLLTIAASPPEASLIILGGGATVEDAERARQAWVDDVRLQPVAASEGWPRVMASDTVAGLKPGLQIAVLGACPFEQIVLAQAAASARPGAYLRRVPWPGPFACPAVQAEFKVTPVAELTRAGFRLRVTKVQSTRFTYPVFELLGPTGALTEVRGADFRGAEQHSNAAADMQPGLPPYRTSAGDVTQTGDRFEVAIEVRGCSTVEMTQRVALAGGKFAVTWVRGKEHRDGHCDD